MIYKCIFGFACTWLKKYFSMHMNHLLFCVTVKIKPHTSEFHQCISDAQIFLALIFFHWKFNNYVFKMIWNCDYFYIGEYAFTHWFWSVHFRMCRFLPHSKITCRHSDVLHFLSCLSKPTMMFFGSRNREMHPHGTSWIIMLLKWGQHVYLLKW